MGLISDRFNRQQRLELVSKRQELLDYYYTFISQDSVRQATELKNHDLLMHKRGNVKQPITQISSLADVRPTPRYKVAIYNSSGTVVIPETGLQLKKGGKRCNTSCVNAGKNSWLVRAYWLAVESSGAEFYIEVNYVKRGLKSLWKFTYPLWN